MNGHQILSFDAFGILQFLATENLDLRIRIGCNGYGSCCISGSDGGGSGGSFQAFDEVVTQFGHITQGFFFGALLDRVEVEEPVHQSTSRLISVFLQMPCEYAFFQIEVAALECVSEAMVLW
jgi:hypothetical protein